MSKIKLLSLTLLSIFLLNCNDDRSKGEILYDGPAAVGFASQNVTGEVLFGTGSADFSVFFGPLTPSPGATVKIVPIPLIAGDVNVPAVLGVDYTIVASTLTLGNEVRNAFVIKILESGATTLGKKALFKLESTGIAGATFNKTCAVTLRLSCPVLATQFAGNYLIQETTPFVDGPTLSTGTVVALSVIPGSTGGAGRTFRTKHYPDFCAPLFDFNFDLICNRIIARPNQAGICNCSGTGNRIGPATVSTSYVDGATNFTLRFTNDVAGNCGPAVQTTYSFTKQ